MVKIFLGVGNPRHPTYNSVFEVGFVLENPLQEWYSRSTDWCLSLLEKLQSADLDDVVGLKDVIYTDQSSVTIKGDVIFEKGFVTDSLRTPKVSTASTSVKFKNVYSIREKFADLLKLGVKSRDAFVFKY